MKKTKKIINKTKKARKDLRELVDTVRKMGWEVVYSDSDGVMLRKKRT